MGPILVEGGGGKQTGVLNLVHNFVSSYSLTHMNPDRKGMGVGVYFFCAGLSLPPCRAGGRLNAEEPVGRSVPAGARRRAWTCACVCRITLTQAKLTHRAIFTPG